MCFDPDPYHSAHCWLSKSELISGRSGSGVWELMILMQWVSVVCFTDLAYPWQWPSSPVLSLSGAFQWPSSWGVPYVVFLRGTGLGSSVSLSSWRGHLALSIYLSPGCLPSLHKMGCGEGHVGPAVSKDNPSGPSCFEAFAVAHSRGLLAEPKGRRELPTLPNLSRPYFKQEFQILFWFTTP